MWILGVRCKMVYMINCLLSAPLLIWWKGESSSNSILPIQRKCTAFYWHTIQSYCRVSDTMQNGVLLPIDVHDYLEKSHFWPSQMGTTHYLWLCLCCRPLCFFSAEFASKASVAQTPSMFITRSGIWNKISCSFLILFSHWEDSTRLILS